MFVEMVEYSQIWKAYIFTYLRCCMWRKLIVYVSAEPVRLGLTCMPPQREHVVTLGSASISQFQTSVSAERQVLGGHFQATVCSETASPLKVEPAQEWKKVRYQEKLCTYVLNN